MVTWGSDGQDGDDLGVYAQIFQPDGIKVGSEFQVNTYTTSFQWLPATTALSNSDFVVAWLSVGQDGSDSGIYAQLFQSNGTKVGSEFQINTFTPGDQEYSTLTALSNSNFVVTWESDGQDGDDAGIYAQIFYSDSLAINNSNQALTYTEDNAKPIDNLLVLSADTHVDLSLTLVPSSSGVLTDGTDGAVTSTYNTVTGIWQVSGEVNTVNDLLANTLAFIPINDYDQDVTIAVSVTDSITPTPVTGVISLTAIPVNDAPILNSNAAAVVNFSEGGSGVVIDAGITITDIDSNTLTQSTVTVTDNLTIGEDVLMFSNLPASINGNYDATTGTLTLSGITSLSDYQQAVRSIQYLNTANAPNAAPRTVMFMVNDGGLNSNLLSRTGNIIVQNAPFLVNNRLAIE